MKDLISSTGSPKISSEDLPALFRSADKASTLAQKQFVTLTAANLGLLIAAAVVGSIALSSDTAKVTLALISAVLLTASIFVSITIRMIKLERIWYDGRAIAESFKTITWRYMTGSDPYPINLGDKADSSFISALSALLAERKNFAARMDGKISMEQQITDKMRTVRQANFEERKKIYLSDRIDDQRRWYCAKTEANLKASNQYFAGMIISQALAVISAFVLVAWPQSPVRFTGFFTTLAAAFLAWTQMKKNEQLAQSYGLAAQELNLIHEQGGWIKTDEELSDYVTNSENAISREHTMWLARSN